MALLVGASSKIRARFFSVSRALDWTGTGFAGAVGDPGRVRA
jgi:hypothetical protein